MGTITSISQKIFMNAKKDHVSKRRYNILGKTLEYINAISSIHSLAHSFTHLPMHLYIHPRICLPTHPCTHTCISLLIHPFTNPPIYSSICLLSIHPHALHSTILLLTYPSTQPSTYPLIHFPHLSTHSFTCPPFIHPSIHLSIFFWSCTDKSTSVLENSLC